MIDINELRRLAENIDSLILTKHIIQRFEERGIILADVRKVILQGEIIEQYPEDYPFPSCLLLGLSINGEYLHACVASNHENIFVITAYHPGPDEWESDLKTRKKAKL